MEALIFVLGPCVIESADHAVRMASLVKRAVFEAAPGSRLLFKASFDKANRTSLDSFRGPGLREGLAILDDVKEETGCLVTTDIHEPGQAEKAARVVDVLQIPALLSRQTDLLVAAGRTGRAVNIKKGQFTAPLDMAHAIEKARRSGAAEVWVTERGTTFGYHDLVVDMRSISLMRRLGVPVIFDATHSVQKPSAGKGCSAGEPEFIPVLSRAAVAAGADGVFMEVHDDPERAKSDGPNSLRIESLPAVLRNLVRIKQAVEA